MAVGKRFDFDAAREEARAKKQAAKMKALISNVVLGLVAIVVLVGGKVGWDKWQEKRAEDKARQEAAELAEQQAQAERKRKEEKSRAEAQAKRERERKEQEAARERERREREEARERERREREEARRQAEEARKREQEDRAAQQELKRFIDREVGAVRFEISERVAVEAGSDRLVEVDVDDQRWQDFCVASRSKRSIDVLDLLRDKSITEDFSDERYPSRETFDKLMANLAKERFMMVVKLQAEAIRSYKRLTLVSVDKNEGLVSPKGARVLKDNSGRVLGWTIPFVYGDNDQFFVMSMVHINKHNREWREFVNKVRRDASKLSNKDEYVDTRLSEAVKDFVASVRIELKNPPPDPELEKKAQAEKKAVKPKIQMRGGSDIRSMKGSRALR